MFDVEPSGNFVMVMSWSPHRVPKVGLPCDLSKPTPGILFQGLLTALKFLRNYFPNKKSEFFLSWELPHPHGHPFRLEYGLTK